MHPLSRRVRQAAQDFGRALAGFAARLAEPAPATLRIGYLRDAIPLLLLKQQATLELRFPASRVQWVEFGAELPLLEALAAGHLELGFAGASAPVFAQAAGREVGDVGAEPSPPRRLDEDRSVHGVFYLASAPFAARHPHALLTILDELAYVAAWSQAHGSQAARLIAAASKAGHPARS